MKRKLATGSQNAAKRKTERKTGHISIETNELSLDFRDLRQQIPQLVAIQLADARNTLDVPQRLW
jgi:hypothetical protein